jgi:DNA gyrase subunit A
LLTVCQNGYGKRTRVDEYRKTRRGGKGVINIRTTERNGSVVALMGVTDTDELMFISAKGSALRTDLTQLREIGRATQGVRLIRLGEGDNVVSVARIAREEDEEAPEGNGTPQGGGEPEPEPTGTTAPGPTEQSDSEPSGQAATEAGPENPRPENQGPETLDMGPVQPADNAPESPPDAPAAPEEGQFR